MKFKKAAIILLFNISPGPLNYTNSFLAFRKCVYWNWLMKLVTEQPHRGRKQQQGVNFINILRARFSYINAFFAKNVTRQKHFFTKNLRIKCWWNWQ